MPIQLVHAWCYPPQWQASPCPDPNRGKGVEADVKQPSDESSGQDSVPLCPLTYLKFEISGQNSYTVSLCKGMVINPSISFYMLTKDSGFPSSRRGMTIRYKTTFDHGTDDGLPMNCSSQLGSMAVIRSFSELMIAGDSAAILQEKSHNAEEQVHRNAWA